MREIKFRAWDKVNNKMTKSIFGQQVSPEWYINHDKYIVMQYTGLKEKNDNEIYEGDIVYYNQGMSKGGRNSLGQYEPPIKMDGIRVVVWKDKGFDWEGEHSGLMFCRGGQDKFEVIGNIYENKELLKEKGVKNGRNENGNAKNN